MNSAGPQWELVVVPLLALSCAGHHSNAERLVRKQLIDPQSAQFPEVVTIGNVTCGLVNSKNRMVSYRVRQLFLVRYGKVFFA